MQKKLLIAVCSVVVSFAAFAAVQYVQPTYFKMVITEGGVGDTHLCQVTRFFFFDAEGNVLNLNLTAAASGTAASALVQRQFATALDYHPAGSTEIASKMFEDNNDYKWCFDNTAGGIGNTTVGDETYTIVLRLEDSAVPVAYNFCSAGDDSKHSNRAFASWTLYGSADGVNWSVCDEVSNLPPIAQNNTWYNGTIAGDTDVNKGRFPVAPIGVQAVVSLDSFELAAADSAKVTGTMTLSEGTSADVSLMLSDVFINGSEGEWDETKALGEQSSDGPFEVTVNGLTPDRTYYAALCVSNDNVLATLSRTVCFITGTVSVQMPSAFCEAETQARKIVFSRPATCVAGNLVVKYALSGDAADDYAATLTGSAVIPDGETSVAVSFTPMKDTVTTADKTLTVTVLPQFCCTNVTSSGSVTILDTASVTALNPSWTGNAGTMDWDTPRNWSSGAVPNYLDTVTIDAYCSAENPVVKTLDENYEIYRLQLGNDSGSYGSLLVTNAVDAAQLYFTKGLTVGVNGEGRLVLDNGGKIVGKDDRKNSDPVKVGAESGSSGTVVVGSAANAFNAWKFLIGDSGRGEMTINGGTVSTYSNSYGDFILGNAASGEGVLTVNGGVLDIAHAFIVGGSGHGVYTNLAGNVSGYKESCFAKNAGSSADVAFFGGKISISGTELILGGSGHCRAKIFGGQMVGRGIQIGASAGSIGELTVYEGGSLGSTDNSMIYVGALGTGILRLQGGSVEKLSSGNKLSVRNDANAYGLITGWGNVTLNNSKSCYFRNNGLVIADGKGEDGTAVDRSLTFNTQANPFENTIENDSTNGWYAVNKGMLSLAHPAFSLAVGDSGICTWGEAEADAEIDLVNSARVTFKNITTAVTSFTGKLYSSDRSDVPAMTGGKVPVGVWKFDISGTYDSAEVEFRYDHIKAPRGVRMYQLNEDDATWKKLDTVSLSNYRARVAVTSASRMFAALPAPNGLALFVR